MGVIANYTYTWDDTTPRNPSQLAANRKAGVENPPSPHPLKTTSDSDVEVYVVMMHNHVYAVCDSWEAVIDWLNSEEREWRFHSVFESVWMAHRYVGGSGPCGDITVKRRYLYNGYRRNK